MRTFLPIVLLALLFPACAPPTSRTPATAPAPTPVAQFFSDPTDDPASLAVLDRLDDPITAISAENQSLEKIVRFLAAEYHLNIVVNWKAIEPAVTKETAITVDLHDVPLRRVLQLIIDQAGGNHELGYSVTDNIITISSREDLSSPRFQAIRVYDLRPFLVPLPDEATRRDRIEALINILTTTIDSPSWLDNGGMAGSIADFNGQLIIKQTVDNHRAIRRLLSRLRPAALFITPGPEKRMQLGPVT